MSSAPAKRTRWKDTSKASATMDRRSSALTEVCRRLGPQTTSPRQSYGVTELPRSYHGVTMVMICDDVTWFILVHLGRCIWWKRSVNFWEKDEQVQQKSVPILSHLTDFWWSAALPQCHQPETAWGVPNCHPYLPDLPFLRAPPEQTYRKTESCTSATMSRSSKMLQSWRKRSQGTSGSQNWTHTKAFVFLLSIHLNTPSSAGYSSLLLRIARWTKWDFQPPWWMAENNPQMQSETAMTNQWQRHFQHYWGRKHQAVLVLRWRC